MIRLRGLSTRQIKNIEKFNRTLRSKDLINLRTAGIRNGDSITKIKSDLEKAGVNVSRKVLERSIFQRYSLSTLSKYYDWNRERYGARSGFDIGKVERLSNTQEIKVRVTGTNKDGTDYTFDTYVNIGDHTSLKDVLDNLRNIYAEDNESNKSPLENLRFK